MHNAFIAAEFFNHFMQKLLSSLSKSTNYYCRLLSNLSLLLLFGIAVSFTVAAPSDQSLKARTKNAYQDGDIMIGVLMPMHRQSAKKNDYRQACGDIWEGYGIQRLEQFFRSIDEINARNDLLPGINLGYDVRDSCWTIPVALEQSIDFIRNKIGTLDKQMAGGAVSVEPSPTSSQVTSSARGADCSPTQQRGKTIAALVGPGSSTISGPIQNVLQLFEIPEIDFGATAVELSDKNKHRFFSRVVPSDRQQARVLVDIILRHNWTYIHAVHTEGMYGENGMEEFKAMLSKTGACIAVDKKLKLNVPPSDVQYMELLNEIRSKGKDKAKVIVCFCDGLAIKGIFNATQTYKRIHPDYDDKFVVIGSDGWNVRPEVVEGVESTANGGISIKLHSPKIEDFEVYFSNINPLKNDRNPWFHEFWEYKFNCTFNEKLAGWRKKCDPSLPEQRINPETVDQDAKLGFVVNAVYALAHAFHNMLLNLCPRKNDKNDFSGCPHINQTINGSMVFSYLRNVTFLSYSNDSIKFDEFMDGVGRYEIMNYRFNESLIGPQGKQGAYEYQKIGWWDSGNLWLRDLIEWPNVTDDQERNIESVCSKACEKGKVKKIQEGGVPCCWSCQQCQDNQYIISDTQCMQCQPGWWPDENLTSCLPLEIKYKSLMDKDSVVCVVFALFGILSCAFVLIIFVRHNSTPVVKASTRELTYIILAGVFLSYLTTVPLLMKPTLVSCYFTRILPGLSFSLIYGALATKTNRIARILSGSKKKIITRKPRFLSASAQVVITCLIVGTECVIITLMLILEPADSTVDYPSKKEVRLKCNTTDYGLMVPFGFDMFLIAMCTLYAVRTRNMPENFNEAKFIGFCMYATCAIWASFVPIYYNSNAESRMTTMSFCISSSATAALVFLFHPKIYIMVYQPERNTKSAFSHIGDSARSRLGSAGSMDEDMPIHRGGSGRESASNIKQRLTASQHKMSNAGMRTTTAAEIDEILKDKLVEAIMPPAVPPKMPKPKTISELMHQRRMSVASAGSAERLLAAALRHTRGSMVPMMPGSSMAASRSGSITGSQEVLTKVSVEPSGTTDHLSEEEESTASSQQAERACSSKKGEASRSRSHSESSIRSRESASTNNSNTIKGQESPKQDGQDSQEGGGQTDSSSMSAEVTAVTSNNPVQVDSSLTTQDQRLLLPTTPVALLLPRPSPIPEEDEENADNTSSHRGNGSPQIQAKSSLRRTSSKRSNSLQKQLSGSNGTLSGSAAASKSAAPTSVKATSEIAEAPKKSSSANNDNGSLTYVNLDTIYHHQTAEVVASTAPPLPPKPPRLSSSTPSALAGRLIEHLYNSSRATEKIQRQLEKEGKTTEPGSKKPDRHPSHKVAQAYIIPEGPPRPISPTELEEKRLRHDKKGKLPKRGIQQMLKMMDSTSRLVVPMSMETSQGLRIQRQPAIEETPPEMPELSTANESSGESSTNAEAVEPSAALISSRPKGLKFAKGVQSPKKSNRSPHARDPRSLLISPMSSTSYDARQKPRYSSSSDDTSANATQKMVVLSGNIMKQNTTAASQGRVDSHFMESNNNNTIVAYDDDDDDDESSTASSTSTAVAVRIAHAERQAQQQQQNFTTSRQIYQPPIPPEQVLNPGVWLADGAGNQQRQRHQLHGFHVSMTPGSSERANDSTIIAPPRPTVASSVSSSALSEDTLADLPSIEELSVTGMRLLDDEESNALRFKDYMSNLGVDIDISVFQSTEV